MLKGSEANHITYNKGTKSPITVGKKIGKISRNCYCTNELKIVNFFFGIFLILASAHTGECPVRCDFGLKNSSISRKILETF